MGRIEKPETEKGLTVIDNLTPDKVYGTPNSVGLGAILDKVAAEVRSTVIDVSTESGRKAARSLAYKVARSKTALDDMGKDLVADWKAKSAKVDAERKAIRDGLDVLKAEVMKPVEEWEESEEQRVTARVNWIREIEAMAVFVGDPSAAAVADRLRSITDYPERDWQEFADQAAAAMAGARTELETALLVATKREADAAELEALRREKAEREERERQEREAKEAQQRAEEAERQAEAERQRIAEEAARVAREKAEAEARAAAAAAEAERERIDRERQEAEQRAAKAEQDRKDAEERARLAAEQAERDRIAAAEKAEQDRLAAIEEERKRVADEQAAAEAEAKRREADEQHRAAINRAALDAFVALGLDEANAKKVIIAIAQRLIPNITIQY